MLLIFSFTVEVQPDKKMGEYVHAGNIGEQQALQILQQICIAEAVKANEQKAKADLETKKDNTPRG